MYGAIEIKDIDSFSLVRFIKTIVTETMVKKGIHIFLVNTTTSWSWIKESICRAQATTQSRNKACTCLLIESELLAWTIILARDMHRLKLGSFQ